MSMIIRTMAQLKGDTEPQQHHALVFDDVTDISDFMGYRNALTTAAKAILNSDDGEYFSSEIFYLIQLSEFISSALDVELYWNVNRHG